MPTFQLGPRCQLELGGAPPATHGGSGLGSPEPGRKGSREICSARHFHAWCECTARREFALHALRLCARARDRRQNLEHGMCLIIANVLATSYCNLAAPLVCLDLWEHVESINFPKGRCPAKFLEARSPGRRPIRAKLAGGFFCRDRGESR